MVKEKGWANVINSKANSLLAAGTIGASALLTGCDRERYEQINKADVVYTQNPHAVAFSDVRISFPKELKSKPGAIIDISDPKQVAKALKITLTGDPMQHLFDIVFRQAGNDGFLYTLNKESVTVANLPEKAAFITSIENKMVSAATRAALDVRKENTNGNSR